MPETPDQTPEIGSLVPQKHGGAIRYGGTNKGGGRTPDAWKALCAELASKAMEEVAPKILDDPDHPAWIGALKHASEHGYGRPAQKVEVEATLKLLIVE